MKVRKSRSFRFKMVMYMFLSILATVMTEGIIFLGVYLYETQVAMQNQRRLLDTGGQVDLPLSSVFSFTQSASLDLFVLICFTLILLVMYFILITHGFVTYVREIIAGVERMKSGNLTEEIPVRGEDEFSEIAGSINEMRKSLYETIETQKMTEKTKDELITNVAHDLRTPLTSILGYLDLLTQEDFLTEEQKSKYLSIVSAKARQLETLIKALFDYTRYDKDKVKLRKEILDLNLFVPQLVDEFYPSFVEENLTVKTDYCKGALNIEANGELLARAIGNLLSNAIKYGSEGKLIEIKTGRKDQYAFVSIVNYGRIIPPEKLDKIFDKFYRVENSRSLKTGGTGLGLAIAKNIVNLHNGNIWATSDESGTCFQIELPETGNVIHEES